MVVIHTTTPRQQLSCAIRIWQRIAVSIRNPLLDRTTFQAAPVPRLVYSL